ncbi:MAG TPA: Crp/Fnr family transcriptional regulator [Chitinophagaceae bacterium]|jgi:CRP-like cAMP-binding protein
MPGELSDRSDDWNQFKQFFKEQEVPARTILLREGEVSGKAFYIEKGSMRLWFNNNGKDVTFQFFFEGEGISSIESFKTGVPSLFNIETIETCTILTITKKDFQTMLDDSPAVYREVEENIFQRLIFYQKLFLSRIKDNPEKRYKELIKNQPKILQRIPQHYIASYLGITPVSLSRIRNRR